MTEPAARARKNAPPRETVLAAAMAAIAERGLDKLTMAGLGRTVGMSSGHLLYYFGSKDELLLQTLEWSEEQLGMERRSALARQIPVRERLDAFVELYVPSRPRDPHWSLWLELWNRAHDVGDDARGRLLDIELSWHRDLVALLVEGASRGELRAVDADRFAVRIRALLDGFSTHVAMGLPGSDRPQVLSHIGEFLDEALTPAST
ncbi:TetR/AcrR family transcriptional regulator [Streptomyces beijiangensis]|uniref:TetR family transcriptional regulator n=1 Tax=Streptomyces beijiangensis TaxID=163361 RepID=A0A939JHG7_9ACTN|nr:TetR/AcrR family transcriptional regulator [Streptomyces beijiangensis]MBO0512597.1 TetR family transcriptional regulator [Streptomyces beijiangensis]